MRCQKLQFLDILSETAHFQFLVFCMMIGGIREHYLSLMSIWENLNPGIKGVEVSKVSILACIFGMFTSLRYKFLIFT